MRGHRRWLARHAERIYLLEQRGRHPVHLDLDVLGPRMAQGIRRR